MKIAVIGAGLMGRAVVYDLAHSKDVSKVGLFDIDLKQAQQIARKYGNGKTTAARLDAGDMKAAAKVFKKYQAVVSAVTYKFNPGLTRAAIASGCHFFDLGGNNTVVAEQFKLSKKARQAGVVVIPDCGLAPGMVSVIAAGDLARFDKPTSLHIRVGGLPQKPKPPLNYQMLFSAEGLINEYDEPVSAIRNGKKIKLPPMSEVEELSFRGIGKMEAFTTSGGTSTLPKTYGKILKNLDYKTIRFPGHCQKFKTMLDIGLADRDLLMVDNMKVSPRSVLKAVLDHNLNFGAPDMSLVRVTTEGMKGRQKKRLVSEIIDYKDSRTGLTSMMRCTSFPVSIIAMMAASGVIEKRGVIEQEKAVDPAYFENELAKRKIIIRKRWSR